MLLKFETPLGKQTRLCVKSGTGSGFTVTSPKKMGLTHPLSVVTCNVTEYKPTEAYWWMKGLLFERFRLVPSPSVHCQFTILPAFAVEASVKVMYLVRQ